MENSTASCQGAKTPRDTKSNVFSVFTCICGFAPLRAEFYVLDYFFKAAESLLHVGGSFQFGERSPDDPADDGQA